MSPPGLVGRLVDVADALRRKSALASRERWPRERIAALQQERLTRLVEHASRHSPFYRDLYGGPLAGRAVRLDELPVVTKKAMMAEFDRFTTDRRLRAAELRVHLAAAQGDELHLGEYRVMVSGGSSGLRGIFVYDRDGWRTVLASAARISDLVGVRPTLPRTRTAFIGAPGAGYMGHRIGTSLRHGPFRMLRLPATAPTAELVAALQEFQPDVLTAYPSVAALVAQEQLAGRLRIAPRRVVTSSEERTDEMTEVIRAAWGVEPFNCLALTETGIAGVDCPLHRGIHLFEDLAVFEVVDADHRPVPPGSPGSKVLVTNLYNRVQPLIRFEVTDALTVTEEPCACGRTLRRVTAIHGRSDDVLRFPGRSGDWISVPPVHLRGAVAGIAGIAQFQILHDSEGLDVRIVPLGGAATVRLEEVEAVLRQRLQALGVEAPPVRATAVDELPRDPTSGKLKLVQSRKAAAAASPSP